MTKSLLVAVLSLVVIILGFSIVSATAKTNPSSVDNIVSNPLDMQFNVTDPVSNGGGNGNALPPASDEITVIVDTGSGSEVSKAVIKRSTNTDGTKKDEVTFKAEQAKEAVENAKAAGRTTVRIVIPDEKDEVSRLDITIPKETTAELANGGQNLEIYTENAKIVVPNDSLSDIVDDFYFRVVPIKDETERSEVEERAKVEQVVRDVSGDNSVKVVARPMTIETNLSSRAVDIVLPLLNVTLPTDEQEREAFLADLVIFIEHSDGDRQLVKPEVVEYKNGQLGLKFRVNKFSTFTILNMEGWEEYIAAQEGSDRHEAYMQGYPDHTFKPDKGISRAEMAMILYRIEAGKTFEAGESVTFSDIALGHWSLAAVQYASSKGLMVGLPDGRFQPEKSITRAEMAAIVSHWLHLQGDTTATFKDTAGNWAEKKIVLVQQSGIMDGYPDGTFQPDKSLTRAEAVTLINKILRRGSPDWIVSTWSDVPESHWAFKDVEEASNAHRFTIQADSSEAITK